MAARMEWSGTIQSPRDLASVIQGEARTPAGQFSVASTMWNRLNSGGFGASLKEVVTPSNFNGWKPPGANALALAEAMWAGSPPPGGSTGNALYFANPDVPGVAVWTQRLRQGGYNAGGEGNLFSDRQDAPTSNFVAPAYGGGPATAPRAVTPAPAPAHRAAPPPPPHADIPYDRERLDRGDFDTARRPPPQPPLSDPYTSGFGDVSKLAVPDLGAVDKDLSGWKKWFNQPSAKNVDPSISTIPVPEKGLDWNPNRGERIDMRPLRDMQPPAAPAPAATPTDPRYNARYPGRIIPGSGSAPAPPGSASSPLRPALPPSATPTEPRYSGRYPGRVVPGSGSAPEHHGAPESIRARGGHHATPEHHGASLRDRGTHGDHGDHGGPDNGGDIALSAESYADRRSGRLLTIYAKSADMKGLGKQKLSKHYDDTTFGQVAQDLGQKAGYTVSVDQALASIQRNYWVCAHESFLSWGRRIADELGATFKCAFPKAVFVPRNSGMSATGQPLGVVNAVVGINVLGWDITPIASRGVYQNSKMRVYDYTKAQWSFASTSIGEGDADLHETFKAADEDRATNRATANADSAERKQGGGRVHLDGEPAAQAQALLSLSGARPGVDGLYRISKAVHTFSRATGWTTMCELENPQGAAGDDTR